MGYVSFLSCRNSKFFIVYAEWPARSLTPRFDMFEGSFRQILGNSTMESALAGVNMKMWKIVMSEKEALK